MTALAMIIGMVPIARARSARGSRANAPLGRRDRRSGIRNVRHLVPGSDLLHAVAAQPAHSHTSTHLRAEAAGVGRRFRMASSQRARHRSGSLFGMVARWWLPDWPWDTSTGAAARRCRRSRSPRHPGRSRSRVEVVAAVQGRRSARSRCLADAVDGGRDALRQGVRLLEDGGCRQGRPGPGRQIVAQIESRRSTSNMPARWRSSSTRSAISNARATCFRAAPSHAGRDLPVRDRRPHG